MQNPAELAADDPEGTGLALGPVGPLWRGPPPAQEVGARGQVIRTIGRQPPTAGPGAAPLESRTPADGDPPDKDIAQVFVLFEDVALGARALGVGRKKAHA